jgi:hypothetical protein
MWAGRRSIFAQTLLLSGSFALGACAAGVERGESNADELAIITATPEQRIGSVDDPDAGFTRPYLVDIDRDGNLYVGEATDTEIRVLSAEGRLMRRIGRRGAGPGEFEDAPRFGVVGDTVWAFDGSGGGRITLFRRDGTVLSTARPNEVGVPLWSSHGYIRPWIMRSDGRFVGELSQIRGRPRDQVAVTIAPTDTVPIPRILFDALGKVTDTIGSDASPPPRMARPPRDESGYQTITVGSRRLFVPDPPTTLPQWLPLVDGRIIVDAQVAPAVDDGLFTVTRLGLNRDTVYHTRMRYTPERWSAADLDSIAARAARGGPGGGVPFDPNARAVPPDAQAIQNRLREAMRFPEFRLPISNAWLDAAERVWIRRAAESDPARWMIVEADGRPMGEVQLPADVRLLWSRGDTLWAAAPDADDVPWLVRYRLRR